MQATQYRPEIDGLRAVAVIPVVLYHMGYGWIPGGFLGVDVFFVISGYLISSIIVDEVAKGTFTYRAFWLRRIRRLFPALIVMLTATTLAADFLLAGNDPFALGTNAIAAILSFANFTLWNLAGNYWDSDAANIPLLHTWSLSVEEQFYLLFPFVLALLYRYARKHLLTGVAVGALISFGLYLYGARHAPVATFYMLPTRGWELACGCLLAIAQWQGTWKPSANTGLSLVGLAAIALSYVFINGDGAPPGALAFVVLGSAFLIAFATGGPVYRLLAAKLMVFTGKISYSLYLWHWPILVFARNYRDNGGTAIPDWLLLVAIALVSIASYFLVERPTRQREHIRGLLLAGLAAGFAAAVFSVYQEQLFPTPVYAPVVARGPEYEINPSRQKANIVIGGEAITVTAPDAARQVAFKTDGIVHKYGPDGIDIVVLGDSHGLMWAGTLDDIAHDLKVNIAFFTAAGTSPFVQIPLGQSRPTNWWDPDEKLLFDQTRLDRVKQWKPKLVLLLTRWSLRNPEETTDVMAFLREAGAPVLAIEQPPELFFWGKSTRRQLASMKIFPQEGLNQYVHPGNLQKVAEGRALLASLEKQYPFFHTVPVADLYTRADQDVWVLEGKRLLYIDTDHLSQDGAHKAEARIAAAITAQLGKK